MKMDIVFTSDPDSPDLRLVDVQDEKGRSIQAGRWWDRDDGYRILTLDDYPEAGPGVVQRPGEASMLVDQTIGRYIKRVHGASHAYLNDPTYRASMEQIRRLLQLVETALQTEGVPEETRLRVIRTVVFGAPDEDAVERRLAQHEADMREIQRGNRLSWAWGRHDENEPVRHPVLDAEDRRIAYQEQFLQWRDARPDQQP